MTISHRPLLALGFLGGMLTLPLFGESLTAPLRPEWATSLEPIVDLEVGWRDPPAMSKTRCWWWWLNGNVTKEAITRDLEEMKAKGLGGANIIDAGGADQRGHHQVPHGPDFASPAWRDLFVHALREADRLGLELGFNIQSGWNLGGPTVRPTEAAKKLTWSETTLEGGSRSDQQLPQPSIEGDYYRDVAVLAFPISTGAKAFEILTEASQREHPPSLAVDGDPDTFWVSGTFEPGQGPSVERPVRLEFEFAAPVTVSQIVIHPRDTYGPRRGWVQGADNPKNWRVLARWNARATGATAIDIPRTTARLFRLVIVDAYDRRSPVMPRNVQIAEIELHDKGKVLGGASVKLARIDNYRQKAYYEYPGPFTATKADHLLNSASTQPSEQVVRAALIVDVTRRMTDDGRLQWNAPQGTWKILRFGYTLSGSRVSTSSEGWNGWAIDYLDRDAMLQYWRDVVEPLLEAARPHIGRSLKFMHTDSWELGPVNWTPTLLEQFAQRRGYELKPYLPVLAGYVVDSRTTSNRVLNDFRRTLADLIAAGNYATFRELAHERGLGIHPESGGPHAAPIDALLCLGRNDIPMGEFWARSRTHRVRDNERLFTKQPASAAHIYGKRVVMAEAFTSIGPQWEEGPRELKPVFDRVACEGLNLVMLHTFDCSPEEMGLPGQAYFAGSHVNPNVTWWTFADAFFAYLNRCQFLLQQGLPVADVLYFYGENVPSFVRLNEDDPAGVLPDYCYDIINAEALLDRSSVREGLIELADGISYRALVMPPDGNYGLAALRQVASLVDAGASIFGPKPTGMIGRAASPAEEQEFRQLADRLWDPSGTGGKAKVQDIAPREGLRAHGIQADFVGRDAAGERADLAFFHRRTSDADIYFVVNRRNEWQVAECSFRISGKQPELWDPLSGAIADAEAFEQSAGRTNVPLRLAPNESKFFIFRRPISATANGSRRHNEPRPMVVTDIATSWQLQFDPRWGGPNDPVEFTELASWSDHDDPAVKYYSGQAAYRTTFDLEQSVSSSLDKRRWWLDFGEVKNVAHVTLNGIPLGVIWTEPFRVEVTGRLRSEGNELVVDVINLWPNRLIGDQRRPPQDRLTKTNITKFRADSRLLPSGLLGPVRLLADDVPPP